MSVVPTLVLDLHLARAFLRSRTGYLSLWVLDTFPWSAQLVQAQPIPHLLAIKTQHYPCSLWLSGLAIVEGAHPVMAPEGH